MSTWLTWRSAAANMNHSTCLLAVRGPSPPYSYVNCQQFLFCLVPEACIYFCTGTHFYFFAVKKDNVRIKNSSAKLVIPPRYDKMIKLFPLCGCRQMVVWLCCQVQCIWCFCFQYFTLYFFTYYMEIELQYFYNIAELKKLYRLLRQNKGFFRHMFI